MQQKKYLKYATKLKKKYPGIDIMIDEKYFETNYLKLIKSETYV